MTMTRAGTTMAATVIARHINHEHDKHGRGTSQAGLYLYFACLYDHYYYCATSATKTNSTVQQQVAKPKRACLESIPAEALSNDSLSPYSNLIFYISRYHIHAAGALGGSGVA